MNKAEAIKKVGNQVLAANEPRFVVGVGLITVEDVKKAQEKIKGKGVSK